MTTASLTADLLARKGKARPSGKWLRSSQVIVPQSRPALIDPCVMVEAVNEQDPEPAKVATKMQRVNKYLRLDRDVNRQLKLMAARTDQSHQMIMEAAVRRYLAQELEKADCICGTDI